MIPPSYWQGYLRARLEGRRNGRAADSGSLPDDLRDFVLVALHFPAAIGSLADPWALLELCIRYVPEGIPLVICPHPADHQVGFPAGLEERMRRRPSTWFVRSVPTWLLLDRASLLITLSSSIGLESLVRGVPTLAIRSAVYTRPGLAQELGERAGEVITAAAISPTDFVPDPRTVAAFLARLEAHHLLAGDVRSLNRDQARAVASRIRQLATSPAR